jgi:hypothetical protein
MTATLDGQALIANALLTDYIQVMRRQSFVAVLLLASVTGLSANDAQMATKFLRDYVRALQLTRAGDGVVTTSGCGVARAQYAQARDLVAPYTIPDPKRPLEMEQASALFLKALARRAACGTPADPMPGQLAPLAASGVTATWTLVNNSAAVDGMWVGSRERRRAIHELEQTFGITSSGPKAGQNDLETAASWLAFALAHPAHELKETDWSAAGVLMRESYHAPPERH